MMMMMMMIKWRRKVALAAGGVWWWAWLSSSSTSTVMAAASGTGTQQKELNQTPTWAVSSVCAIIIIISILLHMFLHNLGSFLTDRHKRALFDALEKVKAELMVMGFISLLLSFGQNYITKICIPSKAAHTMLPCLVVVVNNNNEDDPGQDLHRRLLSSPYHRLLSSADPTSKCSAGHEPLISFNGLHQLHILIFFLAVFHVIYSFATMMLGRLKIRGWKEWEKETQSQGYEFSNDPSRFRLTHETSFVRAHTSFWTKIPIFFYIGCFLRQFFRSVKKTDYMTLRNGFITVHLAPGSKFNFQQYIKRSLEDDFKLIVGVSPVLWASFVVFLLLNVRGWHALFWASLLPIVIILAVGTKLQAIMTKMALEITERHAVVQGIPLVQASDKYFWLGRPHLILHLIHFALFMNAFQITYFLWIWYSFGLKSCYHDRLSLAIVKVALGVAVLFVCSYVTLPLYALVTQMGSSMKRSVFDDQTSKALKKWHMAAKKKKQGKSPTRTLGESVSPRPSIAHTLQRFKTTGHSTRSYKYDVDHDASDMEAEALSPATTGRIGGDLNEEEDEVAIEMNEPLPPPPRRDVELEEETSNNLKGFSFAMPGSARVEP